MTEPTSPAVPRTASSTSPGSPEPPDWTKLTLADLAFFEALVRLKSLKAVAQERGLSRPAASRALTRLREAAGTPLFVRSNPHLIPTAEALRHVGTVRRILEAGEALTAKPIAAPSTMRRTFRVGAGENAAYAFCVPVAEALFAAAPGVRMEIRHFTQDDLFAMLADGRLDCAFYPVLDLPEHIHGINVAKNNVVTIVRRGHPLIETAKRRPIRSSDLNAFARVCVEAAVTRLPIDTESSLGLFHKEGFDDAQVSVPYFLTALGIVSRTDALLTVAKRTAEAAARLSDEFAVLPIASRSKKDYDVRIVWHERLESDPDFKWLLGLFRSVLAPLTKA